MNERYDSLKIEKKWREIWDKQKKFQVDLVKAKKPFYNLMMFPYPSGEGLHVGHVYAFGGADSYGRFKRLQGFDVFEPMGFDSFGIHSENYAIKIGTHPRDLIERTTRYFREEQLKRIGALYDWDRQLVTSESNYYKWTQWLFIQLFKAGLAVRKKAPVDWCPSCKTVLADEQVLSGKCERCSSEVVQKELSQWFFKITKYADRLLNNLSQLDWSESTKQMQKNWIGKSQGSEIDFPIKDRTEKIRVYTTRPDTLWGATFLVLSPEHKLAEKISTAKQHEAVGKYIAQSKKIGDVEKAQAKTGVFTGAYAINPVNKKEIPVWIADYVLSGYGTGSIMAVPAHDQRDWEFAKKYDLEIIEVISGGDVREEAYIGEGKLVNSDSFNDLDSKAAIAKVIEFVEKSNLGTKQINFHLRDWLISRQRYWGPPIPMIFCESCAEKGDNWFTKEGLKSQEGEMAGWYPVDEKDLPVELPYLKNYQPKGTGISPLASVKEFVEVACPGCGSKARRETDVSDTFLDSSWYFLRYPTVTTADAENVPFDRYLTKKWLPVDTYIGGNEHAVLHMLYSRFVTMALHDMGHLDFEEPFKKFRALGLIIKDGAKMSKSRGNVVNPNEYMDSYGADTLRTYLLFIGPYELGGDFSDRAIIGVHRFLNRVWQFTHEVGKLSRKTAKPTVAKQVNKVIKKLTEEIEALKFNTSIASLMELLNFFEENREQVDIESVKKYLIVLSVFAPFISEELWQVVGEKGSVHDQSWPSVEEKYLAEEKINIPVQVVGKVRGVIEIPSGEVFTEKQMLEKAEKIEQVSKFLEGKSVEKVVYVPGKILNIVLK